MNTADPIVYALDIGVYNLGARSQVLSSTTTAWCRLPVPATSLAGVVYSGTPAGGQFQFPDGPSAACGRSIEQLARLMANDIKEGRSLALGFEAPMWFPTQREHSQSLSLFSPRFPEESGHEWYLQAGAAATLKAASLGCLLFSQVEGLSVRLEPSTEPDSWRTRNVTLILFEAFVAGAFKLDCPSKVPPTAANEWDAATAAVSWFLAHGFSSKESSGRPSTLHQAGSQKGNVISAWSIILGACVAPVSVQGPPDCEIVAIRAHTGEERTG